MQLVSGRVLYAMPIDPALVPARFTDVAVTPGSAILVLDAEGRRVFVAMPHAHKLELAMAVDVESLASLAPESESIAYLAYKDGLQRLDLKARRARRVNVASGIDVTGLDRIRWHHGSLVAVRKSPDGARTIVQLHLDRSGQRVTSANVIDGPLAMPDPTAAALVGDAFYYLVSSDGETRARAGAPTDVRPQIVVKRATLK